MTTPTKNTGQKYRIGDVKAKRAGAVAGVLAGWALTIFFLFLGQLTEANMKADIALQRQDRSCIALDRAWVRETGHNFPCETPYRDFLQSL